MLPQKKPVPHDMVQLPKLNQIILLDQGKRAEWVVEISPFFVYAHFFGGVGFCAFFGCGVRGVGGSVVYG